MLRQLARLTRPLPAAGDEALALAVYTGPDGGLVVARESGFEGVACVDDTARLLDLLCDVWARTRSPGVERWARGLIGFVLWMQEPDGRWLNFVFDWDGTRNEAGITSSTGENFWHARALSAVSHAWLTFGDERARSAMHRGLDHAATRPAPADVRALHVLVGLRLLGEGSIRGIAPAVRHWAEEIAACRLDGMLMNNPDERGEPHLWAHIQEGVLVEAGEALGDPRLFEIARESADAVLVPFVDGVADRPSVTPYDVACAVYSLDRLAGADGGGRWRDLATTARTWFDRSDWAGRVVYDREIGRVADGVDEGRVSENSGAEANVVAAEALPDAAMASTEAAVSLLPPPRASVMRT